MARNNVIRMNTLHLNSVRLNGIGEVQSVSLSAGADPEQPPVTPQTYTLAASVTNGMVSATLNGSAVTLPFTANEGDTIVVEVTPNDGYTFEGWTDGNTDNPRTITMTADVVLSAQCMEVVVPSKYIQFEDPAVEAICVANWSSDGIGLTMEDAAAVTSLGAVFYNNTEITSFDELQYFTGLTKLYGNSSLGVFYNCSNLKSVKIPASVTEIGLRTFANCNALTDVGSLDNVEIIGDIAFANTNALAIVLNMPKLREIQGKNNFTYSGITGIESLGSVTKIPDGTAYNNGVFAYCSALAYVNLSDSVTYIGAHSFRDCTSLSQINIPSGVTTIGADAFNGCTSLAFDELNLENLTTLGQNAFYGVKIKKLVLSALTTLPNANSDATTNYGDKTTLEEIVLSIDVTSIPNYSFVLYANAKFVMNQAGITSIGSGAFKQSGLDGEVNFPNLTGVVGGNTFSVSKISSVKNLGSITEIGAYAFQNCDSLEFVDLPATLTKINKYAFSDNATPMTMVCRATTPPTLTTTFTSSTVSTIYVPDASLEAYKTATNWNQYSARIKPLSEYAE